MFFQTNKTCKVISSLSYSIDIITKRNLFSYIIIRSRYIYFCIIIPIYLIRKLEYFSKILVYVLFIMFYEFICTLCKYCDQNSYVSNASEKYIVSEERSVLECITC